MGKLLDFAGNHMFGAADLVTSGIGIVQNEQIKSALRTVQTLQTAGLFLNAASIGISIAGHAIVCRKIAMLKQDIDAVRTQLEAIDTKIEKIWIDRWERDCQSLATLADQLDETWYLSDPGSELSDIAREAYALAGQFEREARQAAQDDAHFLAILPNIEAYALASAISITARMAMDECAAALQTTAKVCETFGSLMAPLRPTGAVLRELQDAPDALFRLCENEERKDWGELVEIQRSRFIAPARRLRSMEAANASRLLTIEALVDEGASGRAWLESASNEQDSPILFWDRSST